MFHPCQSKSRLSNSLSRMSSCNQIIPKKNRVNMLRVFQFSRFFFRVFFEVLKLNMYVKPLFTFKNNKQQKSKYIFSFLWIEMFLGRAEFALERSLLGWVFGGDTWRKAASMFNHFSENKMCFVFNYKFNHHFGPLQWCNVMTSQIKFGLAIRNKFYNQTDMAISNYWSLDIRWPR